MSSEQSGERPSSQAGQLSWHSLTPESVGDLTERYAFGDACVREVSRQQTYGKGATSTASVVIELARNEPEPEWVTLRLELGDVRDFRIVDANTFSWVLLDDLNVVRDATGRLHVDLDNVSRADFRTPDQMAEESHLYFSAREVRWAELPLEWTGEGFAPREVRRDDR
ncbi:hypothetical protein GCM10010170_084050 [Dactylosporangium salmoneum]|uniref:Uncharacterized protein n=1 Tax=Dactylosporangium salmoneum TaxID=53361 RepID=A0ABP5UJ14_9ACTN